MRATGHALYYAFMGTVCAAFIVMGVIAVFDRDRPVFHGTFTERSTTCDSGPRGSCTSTGRWVSDDRTITKNHVELDGDVDHGGSVRATYQPGGLLGDDENNIVHTGPWSSARLWFPWAAAPTDCRRNLGSAPTMAETCQVNGANLLRYARTCR